MAKSRRVTIRPSERRKLVNLRQRIESLYRENNEELDVELEAFVKSPPEKPTFPILMLTFAFLKDFLDVLDLLLIGMIFTTILSFILAVILYVWVFTQGGGWWKRKLIRWILVRCTVVVFLEFIPLVKIIPATTILILMVHYKENKLVQLANQSLEMIQSFNIKFK